MNITVFFCCINSTSYFTSFAEKHPQRVTVHGSKIRKDVIEIFSNPSILSYTLDVVVIDAEVKLRQHRAKRFYLMS